MLEKILEKFITRCNARRLAKSSINQYSNCVKNLEKYIADNDIKAVTEAIMEDYFAERNIAKTSLRNEFVALNTFFTYAYKHGYMDINPMANLEKPRTGQHAIRVFSETEIYKILSSCDQNTFVGLRNYTIMNTLLSTGVRVSELCGIKLEDIDWDNNWILVHGKGDKDRFIPMSNSLRKILAKYLKQRKIYLTENHLPIAKNIFVSRTGKPLLKDEIGNTFLDIKHKIGATGSRFSPHTFRHTFATLWLRNGGDLVTLQKVLGHSSITTTRIYINLSSQDIQNQMLKFNPLDNESWKFL